MKARLFKGILAGILTMSIVGCGANEAAEASVTIETPTPEASVEAAETPQPTATIEPTTTPTSTPEEDDEVEGMAGVNVIDSVQAGSNQINAPMLSLGNRVLGTIGQNGIAWYAFETEEKSGIEYDLTIVNMNNKGTDISCGIYDKKGDQMENAYTYDHEAEWNGYPRTISAKELEPGTTYYVQVTCELEKDIQNDTEPKYALLLRSSDHPEEAYSVTDNLSEDTRNIIPGTNLVEAAGISVGDDIQENFKENTFHWYKFRTLPEEGGTYNVTVVNMTVGSPEVAFRIMDDYGNEYAQTYDHRAEDNGKAATISSDQLQPDKVYYIEVWDHGTDEPNDNEYDLALSVDGISDGGEEVNTTFVEPFSLDETQVRFIANKAEFVDPAEAKKVLEPVAEKILQYPDNKILIAGTTATFGSQEAAEKLSEERADAVKQLLADELNVPSDQLLTVGLGFEKDPFERAADMDVSGNFIESEAKKNRRVVIMDADSDAAVKVLGENTSSGSNELTEPDASASTSSDSEVLYCPKCGAEVDPDASFCSKCGAKLK